MTDVNNVDVAVLVAVRAGVFAALEMHIRRSEDLAAQCAKLDEEIEHAKQGTQT